jgi:transposase
MNGHVSEIVETKGFAHVQTCVCAKADKTGICANNTFDSQQRGCSYRTPRPDDSALIPRQESLRDLRDVGGNNSHSPAYDSKLQCSRSRFFGGQASQRSPKKNDRSLYNNVKRSRTKISARLWLSIQFLDTGTVAGASWTSGRHATKSSLSLATDGQAWNSISASEAPNGPFKRFQGLQREKGDSGVFKKRAVERDARFALIYLDECEVHLHPTLTKVWTLKGTRPVVPAAGNNQRLCLYGAFNYKTGRVHYMAHPKKNSRRFSEFLSQFLEANADRFLILVLDNATYHKTAQVLDILTEHENHVYVVWLPKYSPELNAIEGLWGYLKSSALNNYFYGDMISLEAAVDDAFRELQQHPETALSLAYKTSKNLRKTA